MKARRRNLAAILCALCFGAASIVPAASALAGPPPSAMELVFASETAQRLGGQLGVPVRCLGESTGFCSGTVTLSRAGHSVSTPFSVMGGAREIVFVPLRLDRSTKGSTTVHGTATTAQRPGPPRSVQSLLRVR
jgi:hypothetical protein